MKILVTGSAGFIGGHLCRALLSKGHRVVGLDNFDPFYSRSQKEDNILYANENGALEFVEGDIRDKDVLDHCLTFQAGNFDAVIHLAALAGVQPSLANPVRYQDVNINGTVHVLEALRRHGVRKFIFASSSSVYGDMQQLPFREDFPVDHPISFYAATKKAGELLVHTYHHLFGINAHCLRFFTVYGPRQRPDLAIRKFAELLLAGRPINIYGDGNQTRDFTYVEDIVVGIIASLDCLTGYRVYNLGRGKPISVIKMIDLMAKILEVKPNLVFCPRQSGDMLDTFADIELAAKELGYSPKVSMEEGLKRFLIWLRSSQSARILIRGKR